jgi:hypothetical protein
MPELELRISGQRSPTQGGTDGLPKSLGFGFAGQKLANPSNSLSRSTRRRRSLVSGATSAVCCSMAPQRSSSIAMEGSHGVGRGGTRKARRAKNTTNQAGCSGALRKATAPLISPPPSTCSKQHRPDEADRGSNACKQHTQHTSNLFSPAAIQSPIAETQQRQHAQACGSLGAAALQAAGSEPKPQAAEAKHPSCMPAAAEAGSAAPQPRLKTAIGSKTTSNLPSQCGCRPVSRADPQRATTGETPDTLQACVINSGAMASPSRPQQATEAVRIQSACDANACRPAALNLHVDPTDAPGLALVGADNNACRHEGQPEAGISRCREGTAPVHAGQEAVATGARDRGEKAPARRSRLSRLLSSSGACT